MNISKYNKKLFILTLFFGFNTLISSQPILSTNAQTTEILEGIYKQIDNQAKTVVVRIFDFDTNSTGSGVLVKKIKLVDGDRYFILTNAHVISGEYKTSCNASTAKSKLKIETPDGRIYAATLDPQSQNLCKKADLALLSFDGHKKAPYEVAKLKKSSLVTPEQDIYISGFPCSPIGCEKIEKLSIKKSKFIRQEKPFKFGYQIGYQVDTIDGMSGGGVFDRAGFLIGIHGLGKVSDSGVSAGESSDIEASQLSVFRNNSWAIPSEFFLPFIENTKTNSATGKSNEYTNSTATSLELINKNIQDNYKQLKEDLAVSERKQLERYLFQLLVNTCLILPLYKKTKNKD
jgi:Trypsin-like peptidase domain